MRELRASKAPEELEKMRAAQKITDAVQNLIYVRKERPVYSTAPRFMDDEELKKEM